MSCKIESVSPDPIGFPPKLKSSSFSQLKLIAVKVKFQVCSPVKSLPAEFQAEAKTPSSWGALLQGRPSAAGSCIFMPVLDKRVLC